MWRQRISVNGEAGAARVKSDICMYILYINPHTHALNRMILVRSIPQRILRLQVNTRPARSA